MPRTNWSKRVTQTSNALDLKAGVFELHDPKAIARSLKKSAEASHRRKADPYRSAMSMLTFYINRAGKNLPRKQRDVLESAKDEVRKAFGREPTAERSRSPRRTQSTRRPTSAKRSRPQTQRRKAK